MAGGLPPPPTRAASGDFAWTAWNNELYRLLSTSGAVAWTLVDKAGSSIADLQNKNHNLLTSMQGGTTNEYYHLTSAQYSSLTGLMSYGAFSDYTDQVAASTTVAYPITFNTTDYSGGVSLVSSSRLTVATAGVYNLQFSAQLANNNTAAIKDINIWLRKNGTDVTGTNGIVAINNTHGGVTGHTIAGWNYFIRLSAADYVELVWCTEHVDAFIDYSAAGTSPTRPSTASVIATMTYVHT